jgi:hypothetical protein
VSMRGLVIPGAGHPEIEGDEPGIERSSEPELATDARVGRSRPKTRPPPSYSPRMQGFPRRI